MIHDKLKGKTVARVMTNGELLIIETTDGHSFRIKWFEGEPVLDGIDVTIRLSSL